MAKALRWVALGLLALNVWSSRVLADTNNYVASAPSSSSAGSMAPQATAVASSTLVLKASPGNLYGFSVTAGAVAGYVLIYNAAAAPSDGTVTPVHCYALPASTTLGTSWQPGPPEWFSVGVVIVYSSTGCFTQTKSATAFLSGDVQ